jgi:hypothetical protein
MSKWLCSLNLIIEIDDIGVNLKNEAKVEKLCREGFINWLEEVNPQNIEIIEVVERVDE